MQIRELKPQPSHSNSPLFGAIFSEIGQLWSGSGGHFAMDAVLGLEDFERFVFVISVLEHYSEHDCGLLLGCSAREVREARGRAVEELMDSSHMESFADQLFMSRNNEMTHSAISPDQVTLVRRNIGYGDNRRLRHTGLCLLAKNEP